MRQIRRWRGPRVLFPIHFYVKHDAIWAAGIELYNKLRRHDMR